MAQALPWRSFTHFEIDRTRRLLSTTTHITASKCLLIYQRRTFWTRNNLRETAVLYCIFAIRRSCSLQSWPLEFSSSPWITDVNILLGGSTAAMSVPVTVVSASTVCIGRTILWTSINGCEGKHPGGRGLAGGQHHHRTNMDKYHPGYFGKVGMRYFHKQSMFPGAHPVMYSL
jgi:hypothetical protein